jgi:hypothetical protein
MSESLPQLVVIPNCAECGEWWLPADEDRWRLYLDCDGDLVWFCSECAAREFDN